MTEAEGPLGETAPEGRSPSDGRPAGRHLIVVGSTASGKSSLAMELALLRLRRGQPAEIISCDSMQVYRGMDVGTAKPTADEQRAVPHHLIDVVDPHEEFSVSRFAPLVTDALDGIEARGAVAILVGGTGLYVRAVTDRLDLPPQFPDIAASLEAEHDTTALLRRLEEVDPVAADRIPLGNRRRIVRALEVSLGTGQPFSQRGPGMEVYPPTPFALVGLQVPREVLRMRIAARLASQMDHGFVDETRRLAATAGGPSRTAARALGYQELLAHLRGEVGVADAVDRAVVNTGRFAIRQERWFRRDPRIVWFDGQTDAAANALLVDELWTKLASDGRGSTGTVAEPMPTAEP